METLNHNVLTEICSHLDFWSLFKLSQTCKLLLLLRTNDQLWKNLVQFSHFCNDYFSDLQELAKQEGWFRVCCRLYLTSTISSEISGPYNVTQESQTKQGLLRRENFKRGFERSWNRNHQIYLNLDLQYFLQLDLNTGFWGFFLISIPDLSTTTPNLFFPYIRTPKSTYQLDLFERRSERRYGRYRRIESETSNKTSQITVFENTWLNLGIEIDGKIFSKSHRLILFPSSLQEIKDPESLNLRSFSTSVV